MSELPRCRLCQRSPIKLTEGQGEIWFHPAGESMRDMTCPLDTDHFTRDEWTALMGAGELRRRVADLTGHKLTNCWKCQDAYEIRADECPSCGAANANVNLELAKDQIQQDILIDRLASEINGPPFMGEPVLPKQPAPRPVPTAIVTSPDPVTAHVANEWADMAINGLQWLKNIRDGYSTVESAIENMEGNLKHCELVRDQSKVSRPVPSEETGWLIENGGAAQTLYRCINNDMGMSIEWTPDPDKALRFARKEDAQAFAYHDEDAVRIAEHMWCGDADCEGVNCTCRSRPEKKLFHVSAGKYDDNERNCKYCESFDSLDSAINAHEVYNSYPWAVVEYGDYEFVPYRKPAQ